DPSRRPADLEPLGADHGHARRVVAAVLEPLEAVEDDVHRALVADVADDPAHGVNSLGGGLRPPSETSPQDAVRAAGRRGPGAPPSEASIPEIRAAGRPRAGPRASEARNPKIAPAKPALGH